MSATTNDEATVTGLGDAQASSTQADSNPQPHKKVRNRVAVEYDRSPAGSSLLDQKKHTVPEAAKAMGIGQTTLRQLIAGGRIAIVKVGRKVLLAESDIESYLQSTHVYVRKVDSGQQPAPSLPEHVRESKHLK